MGEAVCTRCGVGESLADGLIRFESDLICANCKSSYFQRLLEHAPPEPEKVIPVSYSRETRMYITCGYFLMLLHFPAYILLQPLIRGGISNWPVLLPLWMAGGVMLFELILKATNTATVDGGDRIWRPLYLCSLLSVCAILGSMGFTWLSKSLLPEAYGAPGTFTAMFAYATCPSLPALLWMRVRGRVLRRKAP